MELEVFFGICIIISFFVYMIIRIERKIQRLERENKRNFLISTLPVVTELMESFINKKKKAPPHPPKKKKG